METLTCNAGGQSFALLGLSLFVQLKLARRPEMQECDFPPRRGLSINGGIILLLRADEKILFRRRRRK
jgi:hypothetical protein